MSPTPWTDFLRPRLFSLQYSCEKPRTVECLYRMAKQRRLMLITRKEDRPHFFTSAHTHIHETTPSLGAVVPEEPGRLAPTRADVLQASEPRAGDPSLLYLSPAQHRLES